MTALFWLGVSIVGALAYATGGITYWHARPHGTTTAREAIELALGWLLGIGTMLGWGAATAPNGAMVTTSVIVLIFGTVFGGGALSWPVDAAAPAFCRALLWPLTLIASLVSSVVIVVALNSWRLAVAGAKGPAALGRALAAIDPSVRREQREAEKAQREQRIAQLEHGLGLQTKAEQT